MNALSSPQPSSQPVTLRDVAEKAGLSLPTVSQILNPTSKRAELFAPATRKKVVETANAMGYRPNLAARSMVSGRFGAVTLVLSQQENNSIMPPGLLAGIDHALNASGLHLMVAHLPDQKLTNAGEMPLLLSQLASDGLLINYNAHIPQAMIDSIHRHQLPSVWLNSKQKQDCVYPDDEKAGFDLTQLLIKQGMRKIAYVDYTTGTTKESVHYSVNDRRIGYESAMQAAGLSPRFIHESLEIPIAERIQYTKTWLSHEDSPEAVVCYTNNESSAILTCMDRLGLKYPHDLRIATIHDAKVRHFDINISTAVLPEYEMGKASVAMLLEHIRNKKRHSAPLAVPLQIHPATDI